MAKYYLSSDTCGIEGSFTVKKRRKFWLPKTVAKFSIFVYGMDRAFNMALDLTDRLNRLDRDEQDAITTSFPQ